MSRITRQARLRSINPFDVERIMNENIDTLIGLEAQNAEDMDWVEGSMEENEKQVRDIGDSVAEVNYLTSLLKLNDGTEET